MARRRKGEENGGDTWLNTYADMVTLLLTFFIMLFSMSSVEEEKWEMLIKAFNNRGDETSQIVLTPEGDGQQLGVNSGDLNSPDDGSNIDTENSLPIDFSELYEYLKTYVDEHDMGGSVVITAGKDSVFIRFQDSIFFSPDSSVLKQSDDDVLDFLGNCLKNVEDEIMVININGHTASVPYQNYHISDRRLSSERAASVAIYFEDEKEIEGKKILAIGYGKNYPVDTNDTSEGRQNNRRVDMMIVSNKSDLASSEILSQLLNGTFDESEYPYKGGSSDILLPKDAKSK
ncbi:MAG: flagellar motor protein MotB [Angelakisella sp.]|nr:flagellar motor protein MotB [Angelakisella sp.]